MALFAAGALLGAVGIAREGDGWWVLSGIVFLAAGMILSMAESVRRRRMAEGEDEDDGEDGGDRGDGEDGEGGGVGMDVPRESGP